MDKELATKLVRIHYAMWDGDIGELKLGDRNVPVNRVDTATADFARAQMPIGIIDEELVNKAPEDIDEPWLTFITQNTKKDSRPAQRVREADKAGRTLRITWILVGENNGKNDDNWLFQVEDNGDFYQVSDLQDGWEEVAMGVLEEVLPEALAEA